MYPVGAGLRARLSLAPTRLPGLQTVGDAALGVPSPAPTAPLGMLKPQTRPPPTAPITPNLFPKTPD